jgi:phage major head subunit gpT-like protein
MSTTGTYSFLSNDNLIGLFQQHYEGALNKGFAAQIGMPMPSDAASEVYGWLGASPSLEELKGENIALDGLKEFTYTLLNKEYAKGMLYRDKDLRRDKLGQITARIGEMAQKAAEHWDSLITTLITTNGNGYDGVSFFSGTHAESGTNQVNLVTNSTHSAYGLNVGTATAPTISEMASALPNLLGHFHTFTDDKGDPINGSAREFVALVGTVPMFAALNGALTSVNVTDSNGMKTNPVQGFVGDGYKVKAILTPRLSTVTDSIMLFRADSLVKPFILQEEVPLDPQSTDKNSDEYKKYRRYIFSIYTSRAAGYGRWQSALKATFS